MFNLSSYQGLVKESLSMVAWSSDVSHKAYVTYLHLAQAIVVLTIFGLSHLSHLRFNIEMRKL